MKQTVTFTNIGLQGATQFEIKGFKDESAPLTWVSSCNKDLAAGGSCTVTIRLKTRHSLAESGPVSRSTVMNYEFNDSSTKKSQTLAVDFKVEKWVASVFLTNATTNGNIVYERPEDLPVINAGADSADYLCKIDKNNPQNGYEYLSLIYDTRQRTPYLHWVLFGGQTYFSVMPAVYHQKVWDTSYKQALANNLVAKIYNCIGLNCIDKQNGDEAAWVGLDLNNQSLMDMDTCGNAGNSWKSATNKFHGTTFMLKPIQTRRSVEIKNDSTSCDIRKKIICVSM
ncbi:MAG: hypothetical protein K0R49_298 [Burkholderiales bacterium]|nr:hypothetical protein [Burkholderiales bacterium]